MRILIRTDASIQIGSGHVMRCLTLADALRKRGAEIWFACRKQEGHLGNEIERRGHGLIWLTASGSPDSDLSHSAWLGVGQIADAEETARCISHQNPDWLIVDHYALDHRWETLMKPSAGDILVIDDLADRKHVCSMLLDQNLYDDVDARYAELVSPETQLLLGPTYALLRPEFTLAREQLRTRNGEVKRILVFFGGADPSNATGIALAALSAREFAAIFVDVVVGASNPHRDSIAKACQARPNTVCRVQVDNMAELMSQADLAIGAGGTTTWERCCLGLPSLIASVAENQRELTQTLGRHGIAHDLGLGMDLSPEKFFQVLRFDLGHPERLKMWTRLSLELTDGLGATRVADAVFLHRGSLKTGVRLRMATLQDAALFHHWANDPQVRKHSFQQDPISWENHEKWFKDKLMDPTAVLFVLESDSKPAGQIRFDSGAEGLKINFSIASEFRGEGLAKILLLKGIEALRDRSIRPESIVGIVKKSNVVSAKAFESAGFEHITNRILGGEECLIFRKQIHPARLPLFKAHQSL